MRYRLTTIFLFFYLNLSSLQAQHKINIWLGDGMDTLFEYGALRMGDIKTDYTSFEFMGYKSYWHRSIDENNTRNYNRLGLILTAKTTDQYGISAEAALGRNDDTCFISYKAGVDKITEGRSAALSLLNIFSKPSNRIPQPSPTTHVSKIHFEGRLNIKNDSANFFYETKKHGFNPNGAIQWGQDSIWLKKAFTGVKREKGKLKKRDMGLLLIERNTIIAAMDQRNPPDFIYIKKSISENEKMMMAAYLYMIACYR